MRGPARLAASGILLAALVAGGATPAAAAGALGVSPTRLDLPPDKPSGMLTVRNDGDSEVTVQVRSFDWNEERPTDQLTPSRELVAVPPLVRIAPGGSQIVRVARRTPLDGSREAAYRVLVSEVPVPPVPGTGAVRFAVRFSLPVFVSPIAARPRPAWALEPAGGATRLVLHNRGEAHIKLEAMSVRDAAGEALQALGAPLYVLAGESAQWPLPGAARLSLPLRVTAETDQGELDVALDRLGG